MPRPFTRAQALENRAFLAALRRTGNAHEAARVVGAHRAKFTRRRAKHPAFATAWDAALAVAHAALASVSPAPAAAPEPRIIRTRSGRLQLRRVPQGRLTRAREQAFLAALSATANVRLSAAAAGFSHSAFYARAHADPGFAREMRLALQLGHERLQCALLESWLPASHEQDAWRHNDPPAIPPMSADQALMLLQLHQKIAAGTDEPAHIKRRRGESSDVHSFRLTAMYQQGLARDREAGEIAEAARRARGERSPFEEDVVVPDLAGVARE